MSVVGESVPVRATGDPLKILVVDDEPAMVGALGALLGQAGHRIIAAYDGEEALRRFREDAPDLVLLDLAMPGMDGATVCRRIRDEADTPIIVVSGERDRAATVELLDLGADDYVRKPFRADELLARVRAVAASLDAARAPSGRAAIPGGYELDRRRHEIRWQGTPLPATVTEFRLLRAMVERLGEVVRTRSCSRPAGRTCPTLTRCGSSRTSRACARSSSPRALPCPSAVRGVGYRLDG